MRRAKESLDSREEEPSTSVHCLINAILSKVEELKQQKRTTKNGNTRIRKKKLLERQGKRMAVPRTAAASPMLLTVRSKQDGRSKH